MRANMHMIFARKLTHLVPHEPMGMAQDLSSVVMGSSPQQNQALGKLHRLGPKSGCLEIGFRQISLDV